MKFQAYDKKVNDDGVKFLALKTVGDGVVLATVQARP